MQDFLKREKKKKHLKKCFKNLADRVLSFYPGNEVKKTFAKISISAGCEVSHTAVGITLLLANCFCCRLGSGNKGSLASATAMRMTLQQIKHLVVCRRDNKAFYFVIRSALSTRVIGAILIQR